MAARKITQRKRKLKPKSEPRSKEAWLRGPRRKEWAILVYIAGDNNLSDAGLADVMELCKVGASHRTHVGVEIDTYGEHTGSIRYEITEPDWTGNAHRIVIERLPEKDSGDPETLRSFIEWGLNRYPADNYLLVIWNHGMGFRSIRRDIGYDDFGSSLDMPEVKEAFERAGIGDKVKLAILGFDACLMGMIEIAHHFRNQVDIIVGSQQTEPADGWPYADVLKSARDCKDKYHLARSIVVSYIDNYKRMGIHGVTQSAIDCTKIDLSMAALDRLGGLLASRIQAYLDELRTIRLQCQSFEMADYVDLIHLAELVSRTIPEQVVKEAARALIEQARQCVIESQTYGPGVVEAHGLSVWFPDSRQLYLNYKAKYLGLEFAKTYRGWIDFLEAYHRR